MFGTATPFGLLALVIGAGKRLTRVITALKNRRSAMGLADLDERQLKDIGLTRNDVFAALDTPLYHDPSRFLTSVAAGRGTPARKVSQFKPLPCDGVPKPC